MQTPTQTAKTATLCRPFITRCRPLGDTRLCERVDVRLALKEALLSILHPSWRDQRLEAQKTLTLGPSTSAVSGSKAKATWARDRGGRTLKTAQLSGRWEAAGSSLRLRGAQPVKDSSQLLNQLEGHPVRLSVPNARFLLGSGSWESLEPLPTNIGWGPGENANRKVPGCEANPWLPTQPLHFVFIKLGPREDKSTDRKLKEQFKQSHGPLWKHLPASRSECPDTRSLLYNLHFKASATNQTAHIHQRSYHKVKADFYPTSTFHWFRSLSVNSPEMKNVHHSLGSSTLRMIYFGWFWRKQLTQLSSVKDTTIRVITTEQLPLTTTCKCVESPASITFTDTYSF